VVLALYGIACLYLYVLRVLVTLGGCPGDECMARKVGELVLYACQMEEAVLQIKRLLDDVRAGLAWQLRRRARRCELHRLRRPARDMPAPSHHGEPGPPSGRRCRLQLVFRQRAAVNQF